MKGTVSHCREGHAVRITLSVYTAQDPKPREWPHPQLKWAASINIIKMIPGRHSQGLASQKMLDSVRLAISTKSSKIITQA